MPEGVGAFVAKINHGVKFFVPIFANIYYN